MTYFDHAATTPIRQSALRAMVDVYASEPGNPTGAHSQAQAARKVIDDARDVIAESYGVQGSEVIFTSGGTEADNLALNFDSGLVCSAVEHHAVLEPVLARNGRVVAVDELGTIDLEGLAQVVDVDTKVVSVMLANNETGVVQPIHKVARVLEKHAPQALLHVDAVQAGNWLDVAHYTQLAHMVTVSAHKLGGPTGVGALIVKRPNKVNPILLGGGQEQERRSGTHNVAAIAGFAAAVIEANEMRTETVQRIESLRNHLIAEICERISGVTVTAGNAPKLPNFAHVCIDGVENEALLILLDNMGICASAAASCSSGAVQASHVLSAMGVPKTRLRGAVRISLGYTTTRDDVDQLLLALPRAVDRLRNWQISDFKKTEGSVA